MKDKKGETMNDYDEACLSQLKEKAQPQDAHAVLYRLYEELDQKYRSTESELISCKRKIYFLTRVNKTDEDLVVSLQKKNDKLKKTCEDLKLTMERVAETNAKTVTNMSNTIADLKEKNRSLRSQIEKLEADAKTFRKRVCEDGHRKHQLRATVRVLKEQIDEMQGTVTKTKDQLIKSFEQRARLQDSLEELRRENTGLRRKLACFESLSTRDEKGGLL